MLSDDDLMRIRFNLPDPMMMESNPADWFLAAARAVEAAAYERAAQECKIVGHNMEEYQRYFDACADCADAIRSLMQGQPK